MGIMGGNRGYIHRDIEDALADVNSVVKSHLIIIDATRILTNHGPTGGSLRDVKVLNKLIASTDMVAADAYATGLFGLKPTEISITATAYKRGLGEIDLSKVKVVKSVSLVDTLIDYTLIRASGRSPGGETQTLAFMLSPHLSINVSTCQRVNVSTNTAGYP